MKVFVGTMESGEADFPVCVDAIKRQVSVDLTHFVVSGLPEWDAHQALYTRWNAIKDEYDLFLKVDADTVLNHPYVVAHFAKAFKENPRLTGAQAWLHDYITNDLIYGLTCIRNTVTINVNPDRLYCDRVDTDHDVVLRGNELPSELIPAGKHCFYASEVQAFHYGVHRAKKGQLDVRRKIWSAWRRDTQNRKRSLALLGFRLATECEAFDYSSQAFQALYEKALREYDSLLQGESR